VVTNEGFQWNNLIHLIYLVMLVMLVMLVFDWRNV
jgi:hypothetical protein